MNQQRDNGEVFTEQWNEFYIQKADDLDASAWWGSEAEMRGLAELAKELMELGVTGMLLVAQGARYQEIPRIS